ncbi:hypothetical protein N7478_006294 [Penicillium angulare]|uniref:uncharacterized protein n=1 Tax=Penicillium angulare TaxID=116970 RepID=UPI0025403320|nr:uncharacterized protein N7478_006294 [Penicillium angulare]KAJ5280922.1 hypothetical protein N7478_006294 [Penicillium angulare]
MSPNVLLSEGFEATTGCQPCDHEPGIADQIVFANHKVMDEKEIKYHYVTPWHIIFVPSEIPGGSLGVITNILATGPDCNTS